MMMMPVKAYKVQTVELMLLISDCNPGIEFLIPASGIEKSVILGSCFGIRLTDWSLFRCPQMCYFMHRM